ncbi:hypothetical protein HUW51_21565 [Adhaeribacter swui]|uniref:Uncharacterized protein n=1 Tax=Adhaeribacter swui TaxID=2086471 RepID=A0A7G7GDE3_9BACT|nr:hypothetical protein [Adhaeribacter swui]QNF35177.1 hypothetical protein HUW51_21565 [Adhaeribacter swui]
MKEEEVDQFFKNKFANYTPAPAPDAWARLQSKMESETKQRPLMWVYYAAAVVTLVLVSGALFFYNNSITQKDNNLATLKPITVPLQVEPQQELKLAESESDLPAALPTMEPVVTEKSGKDVKNTNTSTKPVKKDKKLRPGILVAAARPIPESNKPITASAGMPNPEATVATTLPNANNLITEAPEEQKVMEVIIKKDPEVIAAATNGPEYATMEEAIKENVSRKGRLVKNILKQARNLKNGEKVELSTLGLNANYRIDVESKLFKQKYTKVINL